MGREAAWCGKAEGRTDGRDTFRVSDPSHRLHSPGFQHWEDRTPLPLAVKISGGWDRERN